MAGVLTKLQNLVEGYDWEDVKQFCLNNVRTALVFGVSVTAFWLMFRKPRGIPPGPWFTLPVIGDLLWLADDDPRVPLRKMRKRYGDIFSFYLGQRIAVALNGYEMIKNALVKNPDIFSHRPPMYINDLLTNHKGIVFSNGAEWKEQRKFAVETLREFGFGKTIMEDKIKEEIGQFISVMCKHQGQPFDMRRLTQACIANVIASLVFGQRYDHEDKDFIEFLRCTDENFSLVGNSAVMNFMPFLSFLPGDLFHFKKVMRNYRFIEFDVVEKAIREHEKNYDENDTQDFISCYLKAMKRSQKSGTKNYMDKANLRNSVIDLFTAGTDTTSATILWTILYFLHHPDIQTRCYKEVQDVVGSARLTSLKDRDSMNYTQAVILEILRITNLALIGPPYTVTQDVYYKGYLIPKDAMVFPNLDSIMFDPEIWGDPEVFRPERFLDASGEVVSREQLIPFSIGRRVCIGESLARMEVFLFVTTLIQRFELKPVDPLNLPSLKGKFGVTHSPVTYQVKAVAR